MSYNPPYRLRSADDGLLYFVSEVTGAPIARISPEVMLLQSLERSIALAGMRKAIQG